jgi:hypothetical protein
MKQAIEKEWVILCMTCFVFFVVLTIPRNVNAGVTIPNSFTPGTTISSSQMNQNFTAVANQMPGVKTVEDTRPWVSPLPTTSSTVMSITVTVPGQGYVVVTASGVIYFNVSVAGDRLIRVKVSEIASDTDETPGIQIVRMPVSVGSYSIPFSTTKVFSVTTASTVTYYLNMWDQVGGSGNGTERPILTAVFIPNALP